MSTRILSGPCFITTAPSLTVCNGCRSPILAATVGGIDRHIDPAPLTAAGELAALLAGRATYNLDGLRSDHLIRRTVHHIRGGQRTGPIVADHSCAPPQPVHLDGAHLATLADLVRRLAGLEQPDVHGDRPPF